MGSSALAWIARHAVALALTVLAPASAVLAANTAGSTLSIELNRVQDRGKACRLSLVFTNGLGKKVEALSIETVLFDKTGAVERFLVLKSRPLTPNKIRVQQFDVTGVNCEDFGRLLLNDVKECKIAGFDATADCLAAIAVSSRAGVPFVSTTTDQR